LVKLYFYIAVAYRAPCEFLVPERATFFQTEQHSTYRSTKRSWNKESRYNFNI